MCRKGFTLIELLIVLSIIAVLAGVVTLALTQWVARGADAACETEVKSVSVAVVAYRIDQGEWPTADGDPGVVLWDKIEDYLSDKPAQFDQCQWMVDDNGMLTVGNSCTCGGR